MAKEFASHRTQNHWRGHQDGAVGLTLGMPLVRNVGDGIWEVRIKLENRIVRVLYAMDQSTMVLLHGFIKKQQATPKSDLDLANDRLKQLKRR